MKKLLIAGIMTIILAFVLIFCDKGNSRITATTGPGDVTPAPTATPIKDETPSPSPMLEISSAVDFLNLDSVISTDTAGQRATKYPEKLNPGQTYIGDIPNYKNDKYKLRILDKEQTEKILTADDLTEITYVQSECLPIMLRWDDVSVIDVYKYLQEKTAYVFRAYFYYLEDSTVIIVNDGVRRLDRNKECDKAWITVISKDDEERYGSWIPPKGTIVNCSDADVTLYEPYYKCLRNYFIKKTALPLDSFSIIPVFESYEQDYEEWIKWRSDNPEYYEKWKTLSFPKKVFEDHSTESDGYFRAGNYCHWCELFRGNDVKPVSSEQDYASDLPLMYLQIKQYGIPKEEVLEYVRWLNWTPVYNDVSFTEDDVEVLYSGDDVAVRQALASKHSICFEGKIYRAYDIKNWVPAYEIARMFSKESFFERYANSEGRLVLDADFTYIQGGSERRRERIDGAWNEFERISEEDAGVLDLNSAKRVLSGFMDFYKEVKYSPDVLAGEPCSKYDPEYFSERNTLATAHLSNKGFMEIREEMHNVFTPELCTRLNDSGNGYDTVFYTKQFTYFIWDWMPNHFFVDTLLDYYNGSIELFDDDYKLEEHITIENTDENRATATLTARNRSGDGESCFSVEFCKVGGRWLISGGTLFELVEPAD